MSPQYAPIGIFDSGVGGLTILSEIKEILPNENYIYVADQAYIPYGNKTKKQLVKRCEKIVQFLLNKGVKIIVIACNTATVKTIDSLREKYSVPIIGVAPVIKKLSEVSLTRKAAVFATPGTTKSVYLRNLIKQFGQDMTIYKEGETGLEHIIEKGDLTSPHLEMLLKKHLLPLRKRGVDTIALGCTHYPFLKEKIQSIVGNMQVIDSGGAVARQTKRILDKENLLSDEKRGKDWYYTTGDAENFNSVVKKLTKDNIKAKHISI